MMRLLTWNSVRYQLTTAASVALLCSPAFALAQEPTPAGEPAPAAAPSAELPKAKPGTAGHDFITKQAFELTKKANSEAEYEKVLQLCQQGLDAGANANVEKYAHNLMAWAYNRRGTVKLDRNDLPGAMADFDLALQLDPQRWLALHNRGYGHALSGNYDAALADFNRTIELNPKHGKAFINRGEIYYAQGEFGRAAADYTTALELTPNDADVHNQRGHALYKQGKRNDALKDFSQAIRLNNKLVEAFINRGDLYSDVGYFEQAANDYRRAVALDAKSHRAYVSAAWMMSTCPDQRYRDPARATQAAQRALDLLGEDPAGFRHRYLDVLAAAQANAGDFATAVKTENEAITAAPDEAKAQYRNRLELYQEKKPFRDQAKPATAAAPSANGEIK